MVRKSLHGRFGSRYGKRIRDEVLAAEAGYKHVKYKCPSCSKIAVRRSSAGIWVCRACKTKFASLAYKFKE